MEQSCRGGKNSAARSPMSLAMHGVRAQRLYVQWDAQAHRDTAQGSIWSLPSTAECPPVTPVSAGVVEKS